MRRFARVSRHVIVAVSVGALGCASSAQRPSAEGNELRAEAATTNAATEVTTVPLEQGCPAAEPQKLGTCDSAGLLCTYASSQGCGNVYDCHLGTWRVALSVSCTDAHRDGACAPEPERDRAPKTPLEKSPLCLYSGATACSYNLDVPPQPCGGVPRQAPPIKFVWRCQELTSGGCGAGFAEGERCAPEGASCGTTCCGKSARCSGGVWHVEEHGCPP